MVVWMPLHKTNITEICSSELYAVTVSRPMRVYIPRRPKDCSCEMVLSTAWKLCAASSSWCSQCLCPPSSCCVLRWVVAGKDPILYMEKSKYVVFKWLSPVQNKNFRFWCFRSSCCQFSPITMWRYKWNIGGKKVLKTHLSSNSGALLIPSTCISSTQFLRDPLLWALLHLPSPLLLSRFAALCICTG